MDISAYTIKSLATEYVKFNIQKKIMPQKVFRILFGTIFESLYN